MAYAQGAAPDPTIMLRGVQAAREQIPPSRLTLETIYHSELIDNDFTDVIEFDGELRRFEHTSNIPTRPDYSHTVFDGKDVLLYDKTQVSIYNLSGNFANPLYDPRVLGIAGTLGKDVTIKNSFPYHFSSKVDTIGPEEIESVSTWRVRMTYQDGTLVDRWIDAQHNFRVLRYEAKWQSGSRTVRSWYANPDYRWLPSRVVTEDFGSNGGIISRTELRILKAEANVKYPKTTWTLEGFDLPAKTQVTDTRSQTFGYWIDGRVMPAEEWNRLPPKGLQPVTWSWKRIVVLTVSAITLAAPLMFFFVRRSKKN